MPQSTRPLLERIARVLAGERVSINADGDDAHAGAQVDLTWRDHIDEAYAILHTMREPDEKMAAAGDCGTWRRMVEAAIAQSAA